MKALKKLSSLISSITCMSVLFTSVFFTAAADETTIGTLSTPDMECAPGQKIALNIDVAAGNNFEAFDISLVYGDTGITAEPAVSAGTATVASGVFDTFVNVTAFGSGAIKDGTIATVILTIPEDAEIGSTYDLGFIVKTFSTMDADITASTIVKPGRITVAKKLGDANGDDSLNVRDAACISRLLSTNNFTELPLWADFNNDQKINVRDCAAIARILAGNI